MVTVARHMVFHHPEMESRLAPGDWLFSSLFDSPELFELPDMDAATTAITTWLPEYDMTKPGDEASIASSRVAAAMPTFGAEIGVRIAHDLALPTAGPLFLKPVVMLRNPSKAMDDPALPRDDEPIAAIPTSMADSSAMETSPPPITRAGFVGPVRIGKTGQLEMSFTRTEIMIGIRAAKDEALSVLAASPIAGQFSTEESYVILEHEGVSLTFASLAPGAEVMETVRLAQSQPWTAWAEPNALVIGDARDLIPNDTNWTNAGQYYHTLAQHTLAWDLQTGNPSIIVAVTDDGVGYNHPDLAGNIWSNLAEVNGIAGKDDDGNGQIDDFRGWDFNANDNNPLPAGSSTHGTHVSGIIAARTNNSTGVAGTAGGNGTTRGVSIMPIRWDGANGWTSAMVANSFAYAAANGAKIVNSSYNFDVFASSNTVITAFNSNYSQGLLHFTSAGNNNELDPARRVFDQTLFVASQDSTDLRSSFSNYGSFIDITASGSSIYSTTTGTNGTVVAYNTLSGTSMSTPHAAGVAALIWSQNPTWTRDQVTAQLLASADVIDSRILSNLDQLGTGRVNPWRGLTEALPAPRFGRVTGLPANGLSTVPFGSFSIDVPMRLNPASVTAANFELRGAGADRAFDTGDDVLVPLAINNGTAYRMGSNALTFSKSGGGDFTSDQYRFTAFSAAGKLRDPFDTPLDGDSDGMAGGDYVRTFIITGTATNSLTGTIFEDRNGDGLRDPFDTSLAGATQPTIYLDRNGSGTLDSTVSTFSSTATVTVPASGRVFVPVTVTGLSTALTDVDVKVNLTHPRLSDLDLFLISPDGTRVELASDVGGSGANFVNTIFNDAATTAITAGSAPFTNSFRPEVPLSRFNGQSGNGGWLLEVVDDNPTAIAGTTQVNSVTLSLTTPEDNVIPDVNGNFAFALLPAGSYTLRTLAGSGFTMTGPASQTVTIAAGEIKTGLDFGTAKNNRLYTRVYTDANDSGSWESGEAGASGRTVFLDVNSNGTLDKGPTNSFTNNNVLAIPDAGGKVYSDIAVTGLTGTVGDVNVTVNITHPWVGDLTLFLVHPDGTRIELATNVGDAGDNFVNTVFDDEATTLISAGTAPFTGSFRPEGSLAGMDGRAVNGTWRLELQDVGAQDVGQLNNWTLTLLSGLNEVMAVTDSQGNASFDVAAGSHTLINQSVAQIRPTAPTSSKHVVTAAGVPLYDRSFGTIADTTPPTIAVTKIGTGTAQRSRVESVTLTMNELVTFTGTPASAVTISKTGGGSVTPNVAVNNSGPATILTITFADTTQFGSIEDGDYTIALNGAKILDLAQNPMTGTPTTTFHRFYGDVNGDRTINGADFNPFRLTFGSTTGDANFNGDFDANADGAINGFDFGIFRTRYGQTMP